MNSESPLQTGTLEKSWVKWEVLLLLWMAYLLNQGDRQVFNTVLPSIREALSLTDTSVGLIATIFNLFYAFMVPLGGWRATVSAANGWLPSLYCSGVLPQCLPDSPMEPFSL